MTKEELEELKQLEEMDLLEKKFSSKAEPASLGDIALSKASDIGSGIASAADAVLPSKETLEDVGMGLAQGVTFGGADELVGAVKAAGSIPEVVSGKRSLEDLKNLYRQYQQASQKGFEESKERSPYAYTTGEVVGSLAPGFVTAGLGAGVSAVRGATVGARIAQAAKMGAGVGALGGALSSKEGGLTSVDEAKKLALDVAGGAAAGALVGGGAQAVLGEAIPAAYKKGKEVVSNLIEDKPTFRQMKIAKEMGEEGINIGSDKARTGGFGKTEALVERDVNAAKNLTDEIFKTDKELGAKVGAALENAEASGQKIPLSPELKQSIDDLVKDKSIGLSSTDLEWLSGKASLGEMSPIQAKKFIDDLDNIAQNLSGDTSYSARSSLKKISPIIKNARDNLRSEIPEYNEAVSNFTKFRSAVPETLISGKRPSDVSGVFLGDLKNKEKDVFDASLRMIQGATKPGTASSEQNIRLNNLLRSFREIEQKEPGIQSAIGKSAQEIEKDLIKKADESAMLQQVWGVNPQEGVGTTLKRAAVDLASTGRGHAMDIANLYGRTKRAVTNLAEKTGATKPAEFARDLANASSDKLEQYATKLISSENDTAKSAGEFLLKAMQEGSSARKNAALFTIMQNPKMRAIVSGEDLEQPKE